MDSINYILILFFIFHNDRWTNWLKKKKTYGVMIKYNKYSLESGWNDKIYDFIVEVK